MKLEIARRSFRVLMKFSDSVVRPLDSYSWKMTNPMVEICESIAHTNQTV